MTKIMGRLAHELPNHLAASGAELVDKHILVALLRAVGGSISMDAHDFAEPLEKVRIERYDVQDPWRTVIKLEEPE